MRWYTTSRTNCVLWELHYKSAHKGSGSGEQSHLKMAELESSNVSMASSCMDDM